MPLALEVKGIPGSPPAESSEKKTHGHYASHMVGTRSCEPPKLLLADTKVIFTQEVAEIDLSTLLGFLSELGFISTIWAPVAKNLRTLNYVCVSVQWVRSLRTFGFCVP